MIRDTYDKATCASPATSITPPTRSRLPVTSISLPVCESKLRTTFTACSMLGETCMLDVEKDGNNDDQADARSR